MTIKKTDNGYLVDIQPGGRAGRRVRKTFKTSAEAKAFVSFATLAAAKKEAWQPKRLRNDKDALELYFLSLQTKRKDQVETNLRSIFRKLGKSPVEVTQLDVEKHLSNLNAPATKRHHHGYLKRFFDWAVTNDFVMTNPVNLIARPKVPEKELSYLTGSQITQLLELLKKRSFDAYLTAELCLRTGARWKEAQEITPRQLHPDRVVFFGVKTKNRKTRAVPVCKEFMKTLLERASTSVSPDQVFLADGYSTFGRCLEELSIELPPGQRTHVLRHTFASFFVQRGGSIRSLQAILGHQSLQLTMRYAHLSPDHAEQALALNPLS